MKFLVKRLFVSIITLFLILLLTFFVFQIIPGDSALMKLGINADEASVEALRESLGLNLGILQRFFLWFSGVLQGDFGISLQYGIPVSDLLLERFPVTLWVAVLSMIFTAAVSVPLGIWAAKKQGGLTERIIFLGTQVLMAIPPFFLGIIVTFIFGIVFQLFIPGGYVSWQEDFIGFLQYLIFPVLAVAFPKIAMMVRFLRTSVLRELSMNYVRTAISKGNNQKRILWHHILKNALMPIITFMGMMTADVLAGSIIIEQVFNLPGMGRMLVVAISNRDFMVVQACVLYIAGIVVICNTFVDLLYHKIDPRVQSPS